jgi:uncharacterized membrane protein
MFGIPLHLLVVHFPIALAIVGLVYDIRGMHRIGYVLNLWAATGAGLAVLTGLQIGSDRMEVPLVVAHAATALLGGITLVVLAVLRYSAVVRETEQSRNYPALWLVLQILAVSAIAATAVTGHWLGM